MTMLELSKLKPRSHYNHYSNPASQGALMHQTSGFPEKVDTVKFSVYSDYSDRLQQWYADRFNNETRAAFASKPISDQKLKVAAAKMYDVPLSDVKHVRVVHYFNVSNGFSCPRIDVVLKKQIKESQT